MESRVKCLRCDRMILPVTVRANAGLCGQCVHVERRRVFEETVAGWIRDPSTLPGTNGLHVPTDSALATRAAQLRNRSTPRGRMEQVCTDFFEDAHDTWSKQGAAALTEKQKHVLAVETLFGEISNGGLLQYLGNESHAFANWAAAGFTHIGLPQYAAIMERVTALFPDGTIPEDHDACWAIVSELDDGILTEIEQPFWSIYETVKAEFTSRVHAYIRQK